MEHASKFYPDDVIYVKALDLFKPSPRAVLGGSLDASASNTWLDFSFFFALFILCMFPRPLCLGSNKF